MKVKMTPDVNSISTINKEDNCIALDPNKSSFIIDLLSTSLYSDPLTAFLREYISNAVDANIENKKENTPVDVIIDDETDENLVKITIKDSGLGINKTRFKNNFIVFGSTSKESAQDQIGGFGIGRASVLAISNSIVITTVYKEGDTYIEDTYNMFKDSKGIHITLVNSCPTDKLTGTTVEVYISTKRIQYYNRRLHIMGIIKNLFRFCKTPINIGYIHNGLYYPFNNIKESIGILEDNEDYAIIFVDHENTAYRTNSCSIEDGIGIIYGYITYTHYTSATMKNSALKFQKIHYNNDTRLHVLYKFNIGDLDLTPSREAIRDSDRTIQAINAKIAKVNSLILDRFSILDPIKDNKELCGFVLSCGINIECYDNQWKLRLSYKTGGFSYKKKHHTIIKNNDGIRKSLVHIYDLFSYLFSVRPKIYYTEEPLGSNSINYINKLYDDNVVVIKITKVLKEQKKIFVPLWRAYKEYVHKLPSFNTKQLENTSINRKSSFAAEQYVYDISHKNYIYIRKVNTTIDYDTLNPNSTFVYIKDNEELKEVHKYMVKLIEYSDNYATVHKYLPEGFTILGVAPTIYHKLCRDKKARSFISFLISDTIIMNAIKLSEILKYNKLCLAICNVDTLEANIHENADVKNKIIEIAKLLKVIKGMYNIKINNYLPNTFLDLNTTLINVKTALKNILYNSDLINSVNRNHIINKYYIQRYVK